MEVPLSTFLVILVVIAAVSSLTYYAINYLEPNNHPETLTVSNVIPFRQDSERTITYYINFRLGCKNQPATLTDYVVGVVLGNGNSRDYKADVHADGSGYVSSRSDRIVITIKINPAGRTVCNEDDYNKGKDMTVTVEIHYYYSGNPPSWFKNTQLTHVTLEGTLPSGRTWRAIIYLPENQFNISGG